MDFNRGFGVTANITLDSLREWSFSYQVPHGGLKRLRVVNVRSRRWPHYVLLHSRRESHNPTRPKSSSRGKKTKKKRPR